MKGAMKSDGRYVCGSPLFVCLSGFVCIVFPPSNLCRLELKEPMSRKDLTMVYFILKEPCKESILHVSHQLM